MAERTTLSTDTGHNEKLSHSLMSLVGIETEIPVFERSKTILALVTAAI